MDGLRELKVEYMDIDSLHPYGRNAKRHPKWHVNQIADSIEQFGFNDPIAIDDDNVVIEGHGRLMAAKLLEYTEVPVIRLSGMDEDAKKAYILVHNKLTMSSGFDVDILNAELNSIATIDMNDFGFNMAFSKSLDDSVEAVEESLEIEEPVNHSLQHNIFENVERAIFPSSSPWGIPDVAPSETVGDKLWRFMDWSEIDHPEEYIAHFYYDDYKFQSAWRDPDKYIDRLSRFKAVISPDFSLYTDFPRALQLLSCYRRNWCAAYWQSKGLDVIPDVVWGDKDSYDFCFDGLPKHSVVAVSTVGVKSDEDWNGVYGDMFRDGYEEMMRRLEPTAVIFYGRMVEGLSGNIIHAPYYVEEKQKVKNRRFGGND